MTWTAPDGNPIIDPNLTFPEVNELGPLVWITDELMNRATWVTNRQLPGEAVEPATRDGETWLKIVRVPIIGELETWKVEVGPGTQQFPTKTYILEQERRDEARCITRMRWPD